MSIPLNSLKRAYMTAFLSCLLGLVGVLASGCSDHGPVGLYSQELFNKHVNGPNLVYYAANQISFTTTAPLNSPCQGFSGPPGQLNAYFAGQTDICGGTTTVGSGPNGFPRDNSIIVTIANNGGSGTYGPVQATFSSSDPHLVFEGNTSGSQGWAAPDILQTSAGADQSNSAGQALFAANPPVPLGLDSPNCNCGRAISNLGSGSEILPAAQTSVILYQGYFANNNPSASYTDESQNFSVAFYYTPNCSGGPPGSPYSNLTITVPVTLTLLDGLGNTYVSTFYIYIYQWSVGGPVSYTHLRAH